MLCEEKEEEEEEEEEEDGLRAIVSGEWAGMRLGDMEVEEPAVEPFCESDIASADSTSPEGAGYKLGLVMESLWLRVFETVEDLT